jgi:ABC-2 type transport system permease protein
MHILLRMIVKEFLQLRQDRKMIPALVVGPIVQLLALGFAANMDVTDIPLLLVDQDRTAESRRLLDRFIGSGYFDLVGAEDTVDAVEPWLVEGRAQVALVVATGYGEAVAAGRTPRVQVIADGSDSNSSGVGLGYASRIIGEAGAAMVEQRGQRGRPPRAAARPGLPVVRPVMGPVGRIQLVPRVWYNPDLKSRWFYVPAVLAIVLMLVTMILPSMAVVREKEIGTLEQIIVTPLQSWQLILGKLLPFVVIGLLDTLLITYLATWVFGVPLRGSLLVLLGLTLLFLLTTLGLGLLVSTLVSTQQQAMMVSIFILMVPMIYLSGLIFPIDNMPVVIQYVTYAIPVRYYSNIIRGVFLKGSGLGVLWPDALALLGFGVVVLTLASLRFRKSLD